MKYTKKNNLLNRNKLLFKKKTLKKKTIKIKKTQNYNNKIKKKTRTKLRTKTKTKHKGGNSFYNENGYDIIKDVNLDLDLSQSKKKRSIYKTQYYFYRQDEPQLNFIKNNKNTNITKLFKRVFPIMNIPLSSNNFIGMELLKINIKNGKFKDIYYLFNRKKYIKIYSPKHIDKYSKSFFLKRDKKIRCGILYFHSIPNNEELNLQLSIGKEEITKKGLFKRNKKVVNEIKTIPIKEKTAIILRNDTYFKFKINKITLNKPIVILEFNLNCDNNTSSNLFNN